jgi:hypothetical protein
MTSIAKSSWGALFGLAWLAVSVSTAPAHADAAVDWNEITMNTIAAGRPGPVGSLDVALVHIAIHDAVQAIERRYEPYHAEPRGATGSKSAATAAAAHAVLAALFPAQSSALDATYHQYLAEKNLIGNPGIDVGQQVAVQILPLQRAAPNPLPPPALTGELYTRDFLEVMLLGALFSAKRSAEQTDLAHFYTDDFFAQWNRALRGIASRQLWQIGDTARLFALANIATANAVISSWDSKTHYVLWRPLTAIRAADSDGNAQTVADPSWQPLVNNPNYPDYTSGANNVTAAMTRTLQLFFGTDHMSFDVSSHAPLAVTKLRTYRRFSDAARDVVDARVYLGIHFRFADTAARHQSYRVADWVFGHFLLPRDSRRPIY